MSSPHSPPLSPQQTNLILPSFTIVLIVVLVGFFFIGFFSIYFCRCFMDSVINSWHLRRTPSGNVINAGATSPNDGLHPSLILLFPSFEYSNAKSFISEKNFDVECSICLAEFEDGDSLRLLTICYHVFHQECIDLWLKSHKTCPVCRTDLDLPRETLEKAQIDLNINLPTATLHHYNVNDIAHQDKSNQKNEPELEHAICIDIRNDDDDGEGKTSYDHMNIQIKNVEKMERFSRSHSTGHSIAMPSEEEDRYSLRLLEHVNVKMKTGHSSTESCITFGNA